MELNLTQREAAYILTIIDMADVDKRVTTEMILDTIIGETEARDLAQRIEDKILKASAS